MPLYYFHVDHGEYSGNPDVEIHIKDNAAARKEMTMICGALIRDICRGLEPTSDWKMELLDETRKPLFRIRLVAESLV